MNAQILAWPEPDPQNDSPLFNNRIPAEIRDLIFHLALTETTLPHPPAAAHDFCVRYDHEPAADEPAADDPAGQTNSSNADNMQTLRECGADWLRPWFTGRKKVYCALLRTCRRAYLETAHLPALMREHVFYCADDRHPFWWDGTARSQSAADPDRYIAFDLPPYAASLIREMHLHTQMYWIEGAFPNICQRSWDVRARNCAGHRVPPPAAPLLAPMPPPRHLFVLENLHTLHLTFRRGDWWWNENNAPVKINPFSHDEMDVAMREAAREGQPQNHVTEEGWANTFSFMPRLEKLVIDFETSEDKREEMDQLVEWACTWRFPVRGRSDPEPPAADTASASFASSSGEGSSSNAIPSPTTDQTRLGPSYWRGWLTTQGHAVKKMSYRGLTGHFSNLCPSCQSHGYQNLSACSYCRKRNILIGQRKGPRLLLWTVTWTVKQNEDGVGSHNFEGMTDPLHAATTVTGTGRRRGCDFAALRLDTSGVGTMNMKDLKAKLFREGRLQVHF